MQQILHNPLDLPDDLPVPVDAPERRQ